MHLITETFILLFDDWNGAKIDQKIFDCLVLWLRTKYFNLVSKIGH